MSSKIEIKIIDVSGVLNKKVTFLIVKGDENLKPIGLKNGTKAKMDMKDFIRCLQPNTDLTFDITNKQFRDNVFKMRPV